MKLFLIVAIFLLFISPGHAQEKLLPLQLHEIPLREETKLIVNGAASLPGSEAAFTTARGEIWILHNPKTLSSRYSDYQWTRFAAGLRRPTVIQSVEGDALLVRQLSETTRIADRDADGLADEFLAVDPEEISASPSPGPFKGNAWLSTPKQEGPFSGQYFGGSKSGNYLSRLSIVENELGTHSSLFVFQKGLIYPADAVIRLDDDSWLIAQSNRSDPGRTRTKFALQRAVWNDTSPFEVESIRATEKGFHLRFTQKLLMDTAGGRWAYRIISLADQKQLEIASVKVGEDERSVTLECASPIPEAIYHISCNGVWSSERDPVRNPAGLFSFK